MCRHNGQGNPHSIYLKSYPNPNAKVIENATARTAWVSQLVEEAVLLGTDGVNIDIEGPTLNSNHNPHPHPH